MAPCSLGVLGYRIGGFRSRVVVGCRFHSFSVFQTYEA